jgi:hypothetical protein
VAADLTATTTAYLLGLVREELSFGGRSPEARRAEVELERYLARVETAHSPPLEFGVRPHDDLPMSRWTLGAIEVDVTSGSEIDLGLHVLLLAVERPGEHVDLAPLDPAVLKDGPPLGPEGYSRASSRARSFVRRHSPQLAAVLRRVRLSGCTACYQRHPGEPSIVTSEISLKSRVALSGSVSCPRS